jgi:hypothetical protein
MGSLWPKATAARVGLAYLAGPVSWSLTAHGDRGTARACSVRMAHGQCALGMRSICVGMASARCDAGLTGSLVTRWR